jgi:hypothetical protein
MESSTSPHEPSVVEESAEDRCASSLQRSWQASPLRAVAVKLMNLHRGGLGTDLVAVGYAPRIAWCRPAVALKGTPTSLADRMKATSRGAGNASAQGRRVDLARS